MTRKRLADDIDFARMSTDPADDPPADATADLAMGVQDDSRRRRRRRR